jgi:hypothetical protein
MLVDRSLKLPDRSSGASIGFAFPNCTLYYDSMCRIPGELGKSFVLFPDDFIKYLFILSDAQAAYKVVINFHAVSRYETVRYAMDSETAANIGLCAKCTDVCARVCACARMREREGACSSLTRPPVIHSKLHASKPSFVRSLRVTFAMEQRQKKRSII